MISVEDAIAIIRQHRYKGIEECIALNQSIGRMLAQEVRADRDFPPFDRVSMDGIAVSWDDVMDGIRHFRREAKQFAGEAKRERKGERGTCIETATGAIAPGNCDLIIPYEHLDENDGVFTLTEGHQYRRWQNVHKQGSDQHRGDLLISANTPIGMPELTSLATVGHSRVVVIKRPRVAVISTGDELVDVSSVPATHQIRRSNHMTIASILGPAIADLSSFHLNDDATAMTDWLHEEIPNYDLLVFSGGVSMGKKDYLPKVLRDVGIQEHFHKVNQRPGKPLWFGTGANTAVFGLPGNPVSTAVCASHYVRETFLSELFHSDQITASLSEEISFLPSLSLFQPVILTSTDGGLVISPKKNHGSGDLASLLGTHGYILLPATRTTFNAGEQFHYVPWKRN